MRSFAKPMLRIIMVALVSPALLLWWLSVALVGKSRAFPGWSQAFSLLPGTTGAWLRQAFYSVVLLRCGPDACLSFGTIFSSCSTKIGRDVYVGNFCSVGDVEIDDDVLIASHVSIMNGCRQHGTTRLDIPVREQIGHYPRLTIGRDSWIGERATVAASVGRHCVVGAGALVLQPVPDYAIVVGVPARIVGDRRDANHAVSRPQSSKEEAASTGVPA